MIHLKNNWPTKKLGEICEERKEKNIKNLNLPVYTVSHIHGLIPYQKIFYKQVHSKDTRNYKVVKHNDFVFGLPTKDTLPLGYLSLENEILVSPAYTVFSIKQKNLLYPRFLFYLFKTEKYKWRIIEIAKAQSATRHGLPLKFTHLENLEIPLPPLPIQQKIVKVLDTIQSAVEIQEKIIEKTKELKKSLMNLLFHYGLAGLRVKELMSSRVGELKSEELEKLGLKLKKTEIGEIPEHWEVVKIKDVHKWKVNLINPKDFPNEEFEYYSIPAFHEKGLPLRIYGKKIGSSKILIEPGTILFGKLNPKLPKVWLARNFYEGLRKIATTEFLPLIPTEKIDPFFSFYLMESWFVLPIAQAAVDGSTTSRQRISPDSFYSIKIPLPPLPEQQEIAEILQTIDQKIEIEKRKKELCEELFKTMLNKIMSQEIDVEKIEI